jgi:hypothetical protein
MRTASRKIGSNPPGLCRAASRFFFRFSAAYSLPRGQFRWLVIATTPAVPELMTVKELSGDKNHE